MDAVRAPLRYRMETACAHKKPDTTDCCPCPSYRSYAPTQPGMAVAHQHDMGRHVMLTERMAALSAEQARSLRPKCLH